MNNLDQAIKDYRKLRKDRIKLYIRHIWWFEKLHLDILFTCNAHSRKLKQTFFDQNVSSYNESKDDLKLLLNQVKKERMLHIRLKWWNFKYLIKRRDCK